MPKYPKKKLAQLVLQQCKNYGIEHIVISPGSRNAPLTLGFVSHPDINTYSIVDERCAGFFALGMAQQLNHPVALVCTSGSALLNYYPAIAEAFYSQIPLLVLSADRPPYLLDIGDGQTIRQEDVYKSHVLMSEALEEFGSDRVMQEENIEKLAKAFETAIDQQGPVHLNIPFDEPLYETVDNLYAFKLPSPKPRVLPNSLLNEEPISLKELEGFAEKWNKAAKKMVIIGVHDPDDLIQTQMSHLVKDPSVLILTETTSNVHDRRFVSNIDQLIFPLDEQEKKDLKPEILITFGGMVVSKKIKQLLRSYSPKEHWHIDRHRKLDTYHCLTKHFTISPQLFFSQFFFLTTSGKNGYQQRWISLKNKRKEIHDRIMGDLTFSDLKVFDLIIGKLDQELQLQLSNSSVVRYSQLFDLPKSVKVFCNRGTSGIDGSTATAIGAAYVSQRQTLFITGDLSFFYDSNALWNSYIPKNFRIVVINNGGGGIFRFIPGPMASGALDYFETSHQLRAGSFCEIYGLSYRQAKNSQELENELDNLFQPTDRPVLLEVFTPKDINDKCLKNYFNGL